MKRPPANPLKVPAEEAREPAGPEEAEPNQGFLNFMDDTDFLHKIKNPDFPHKGAGTHVPMWVHPRLAARLMAAHGHTGHVIPHPDISMMNSKR